MTELQKYDSLSKEEIMRMTGQEDDSGSGSLVLPKLAINRVGEDDDGNKIPNDKRMTYANIKIIKDCATMPTESEVNS